MSFSASWGQGDHDVCREDVDEDLALDKATLSPPLDQLADDVHATIEDCAGAAAAVIGHLPSASGQYTVSASGHVRQGETDPSYATVSVSEKNTA